MKFGKSLSHVTNPSENHMFKIVRVLAPASRVVNIVVTSLPSSEINPHNCKFQQALVHSIHSTE